MFAFDVEVVEFGGDFDGDECVFAGGFDADGGDGVGAGVAEEFFVDGAFDEVDVVAEGVAVFEEFLDVEGVDIAEFGGFFAEEHFAADDEEDDGDGDADEGGGVDAGASAAGHEGGGVESGLGWEPGVVLGLVRCVS